MSTDAPPAEPTATAQEADDLLSAMADQEVHRMLASVDGDDPPAATEPPPAIEPYVSPPIAEPIAASPDAPHAVESHAAPVGESHAAAPPSNAASHPPAPHAGESAIEKIANTHAATPEAAIPAHAAHEDPAEPSSKTPIWLLPLVWINKPLEHQSEGARNAIGWAAVLTLANALATLGYVYFARHRGH